MAAETGPEGDRAGHDLAHPVHRYRQFGAAEPQQTQVDMVALACRRRWEGGGRGHRQIALWAEAASSSIIATTWREVSRWAPTDWAIPEMASVVFSTQPAIASNAARAERERSVPCDTRPLAKGG